MAAFIHEGLVVGQADAASGIIISVPKVSGSMVKFATIYRANILATGDTASTVVLSGGYTSKDIDQFASSMSGRQVLTDEKPLTSNMVRTLGDAWKILERISGGLNTAPR